MHPSQPHYFLPPPLQQISPFSNTSDSKISLPVVTQIPLLKTSSDFSSWEGLVITCLRSHRIYGHILDLNRTITPTTPLSDYLITRPSLSVPPTHDFTTMGRQRQNGLPCLNSTFGRCCSCHLTSCTGTS